MERQTVLAFVAMLAVFAAGSAAQAVSSSFDATVGSLAANEDVTWIDYQSGSWAAAGNDWTSDNVDQYLSGPITVAIASVSGANAGGTASTGPGSVTAVASASTGPGSSAAYAYAQQDAWFLANEDTELTFAMDYMVTQTLVSQLGESAFADASVGLGLYRADGALIGDEQVFYVWNDVADGDLRMYPNTGTLFVGGPNAFFAAGEYGYVGLRVDGQATAAIPAPGAILLAAVGAGLVGFRCRRVP